MSSRSESTPLLAASVSNPPAHRKSTLCRLLSSVTIEPSLVLHYVSNAVDEGLLQNLIIDKLCSVHFGFDADTCHNLDVGNHTVEQEQVQRLASAYNTYMIWAENLPALVVSFLLGSLGDAYSRRLPVIITFVGCLLTGLWLFSNVYWWWLPTPLLYLSRMPVGFCGGFGSVFATSSAYFSAATGVRYRTTSLSILEWIKYCSFPLGIFLASGMYARGGYVLVYCFYVVAKLTALMYLLFCVGEPCIASSEEEQEELSSGTGVKEKITGLLGKTMSTSGVLHCSGKVLAANTGLMALSVFAMASKTQDFLYVRKMFGWQYWQFYKWLMYDFFIKGVGLLLVMPTFGYYWQVKDASLCLFGGVCVLFYYIIFGTAPASWVIYLASAFSLCSWIPPVVSMSAISKNVAGTYFGGTFAILSMIQCSVMLLAPPLCTLIYTQTLDIFPGTLYLVMAGVSALVCCISVWLLTHHDEPQFKNAKYSNIRTTGPQAPPA